MAITFPCQNCGQYLTVNYLQPGEEARCRSCGAYTVVPGIPQSDNRERSFGSQFRASGDPAAYGPREPFQSIFGRLTGVPRLLRFMVVVGVFELFGINFLFLEGDYITHEGNEHSFLLGDKYVTVNPPDGVRFVSDQEELDSLGAPDFLFLLLPESEEYWHPEVDVDYFFMDEYLSLASLLEFFKSDESDPPVYSRIKGDALDIVWYNSEAVDDSSFWFCRYYKATPYYLRVFVSYSGSEQPPREVLDIIRCITVE